MKYRHLFWWEGALHDADGAMIVRLPWSAVHDYNRLVGSPCTITRAWSDA